MGQRSRRTPVSQSQQGKTNLGRVALFAAGTLIISILAFEVTRDFVIQQGCLSLGTGGFAIVFGMLLSAQGAGWRRKLTHFGALAAALLLLVLVSAATGVGEVANAPDQVSLATLPAFIIFTLFSLVLPWGIPVASLIIFLGGDVRLLWEPQS